MTTPAVPRRTVMGGTIAILAGAVAGIIYGRHSKASDSVPSGRTEYGNGGSGLGSGGIYGNGGSSGSGSSGSGSGTRPPTLVAPLASVPDGGGLIKGGIVITRSGSSVHAFSSRCTHLGCTVNKLSGGKIYCPCHGSVFDATTGKVVAGPAPSPLPAVPVVVKNGGVYIP